MQTDGYKGWTIKGHLTGYQLDLHLCRAAPRAGRHEPGVAARPRRAPSSDDEKPKRILTTAELSALLAAIDTGYAELFRLAAETGCRLGEVLGLVWGDVDFDAQTITFAHQLDRRGQRQPLKTKPVVESSRSRPSSSRRFDGTR
jgi:integrase